MIEHTNVGIALPDAFAASLAQHSTNQDLVGASVRNNRYVLRSSRVLRFVQNLLNGIRECSHRSILHNVGGFAPAGIGIVQSIDLVVGMNGLANFLGRKTIRWILPDLFLFGQKVLFQGLVSFRVLFGQSLEFPKAHFVESSIDNPQRLVAIVGSKVRIDNVGRLLGSCQGRRGHGIQPNSLERKCSGLGLVLAVWIERDIVSTSLDLALLVPIRLAVADHIDPNRDICVSCGAL
mmetsp:Transcript_10663/g.26928  ORF Transcript_10663/g.26928 Transcript_10663/m.26928 type:complete len:235 (+) Transcript_10663:2232-2936(+)